MDSDNQNLIDNCQIYASINLKKQYANYKNILKNSEIGKVCTRFAPEPSGYLHIGHLKASLLNYHYSKIFKGKFILRLDDTNPSKENDEFVNTIIQDLNLIGIKPDSVTYSSDYFQKLYQIAHYLISQNKAYCDNTPSQQMKKQRFTLIESSQRNTNVEDNIKIFDRMIKGEADNFVLRGKIDYKSKNGCMRDPVFFRTIRIPHHRTGTKFTLYPTYDFACPIIDSLEGITHALRSNEFADRDQQYHWILKNLDMRDVEIFQFARLNFEYTVLSKRKLQKLVDQKKVDGWDDPRFPTFRGIMRKGLKVSALIQFMLEQGPSKKPTLMEWNKIWAINSQYIDKISPRCMAVNRDQVCNIFIDNVPNEVDIVNAPLFKNDPNRGSRPLHRSPNILLSISDGKLISQSMKIILMGWGVMLVKSKQERPDGSYKFVMSYLPDDNDFKTPIKVSWVCQDSNPIQIDIVSYDHLLSIPKVGDDDDLLNTFNQNSKLKSVWIADPMIGSMKTGEYVQFQRKGYHILDKINVDNRYQLIYIHDGKKKGAASIPREMDVKGNAKILEQNIKKQQIMKQKIVHQNQNTTKNIKEKKPKQSKEQKNTQDGIHQNSQKGHNHTILTKTPVLNSLETSQ